MDTRLTATHGMWPSLIVAIVVAMLMTLGATSRSAASRTACRVTNTDSGRSYTALQAAVNAAKPGARLIVRGTCVGHTAVNKNLVIEGVRTERWGKPKLSGGGRVRVLTVRTQVRRAKLRDIEILHGRSKMALGAGIRIFRGGGLVLRDVVVHHNRATQRRGAIYNAGTLVLIGSSRVSRNRSVGEPGGADQASGVINSGRLVLNDASAISGNVGEFALYNWGRVTMNDTSVISGNRSIDSAAVLNHERGRFVMNDHSSIMGNHCGVFNAGSLTLNGASAIRDNACLGEGKAGAGGGGVLNAGSLTLNDTSSVRDNATDEGAGVLMTVVESSPSTPSLAMTGSAIITGNTATIHGGGIYVEAGAILTGVSCAPQTLANVYGNTPDDCYFE